jgi:hypothetical protein
MPTAKLFFGGLDPRVSERTLREIAQFAGPVESVRLPLSSAVFGGGGGGGMGGSGAAGAGGNDADGGGVTGAAAAEEGAGKEEKAAAQQQQQQPPPPPPPPHAGFGFVIFEDRDAALYCLEMLRDSLYLYGRRVRVELSPG